MSEDKKLVVVFGVTGAAGGAVIQHLFSDGTFAVRGVTRNTNSSNAIALRKQGMDIVEADLDKPETLVPALQGAYGVAAVTDFMGIYAEVGFDVIKAEQREETQGCAIVDAAKVVGVQHFIWFTLFDGDCPHWNAKRRVDRYLASTDIPYTLFQNTFYFENLVNPGYHMLIPRPSTAQSPEVSYIVNIPQPLDTPIPMYSVEQTGSWVLRAFKHPEEWLGQRMLAISEMVTTRQLADVLTRETGKQFVALEITQDEFHAQATSENPYVRELYTMYKNFVELYTAAPDGADFGARQVAESARAFAGQRDLAQFVTESVAFKKFMSTFVQK
ncbi:NAD(P)-binding protein [Auriculariales sp. MPI-PUGE-AT-0066]|nr:NAD(P)-binding protein [Auriculariales sp. MPI-PUGE-AT-0066]